MSEEEYAVAEAFLILKYGTIENAVDVWLESDNDGLDGFSMLDFYIRAPK